MRSLNALIIGIGSAGDVHPFVGVGRALAARGHRVTVATNEHFKPLVERAGLAFAQIGTNEDYLRLTNAPELWSKFGAFPYIVNNAIAPLLGPVYDLVAERHGDKDALVLASSLAMGARVAQEKLGVRVVTGHLSPAIVRSLEVPPRLPGLAIREFTPIWYRRGVYWLVDRIVDRIAGPAINAFRAEKGLPPARDIMKTWWNSPTRVLAMFPDWYAGSPRDWEPNVRAVGFPLYDETGVTAFDPSLDEFLAQGDPPIAFTPGSAMRHGQEFFAAAAGACARLGKRGILLTRFPEQVPRDLPAGVRHFAYAPFSQLLPRVAALVHHGGIGTTSQALAAGCPQLIMPMAHDQFDNAHRVWLLAVGDSIARSRFRPKHLAEKLTRLLNSKSLRAGCAAAASRLKHRDGLDRACAEIEAVAEAN